MASAELGTVLQQIRRTEAQWREVLAEYPDHAAARQGLLDLHRQRNGKREALAAVL